MLLLMTSLAMAGEWAFQHQVDPIDGSVTDFAWLGADESTLIRVPTLGVMCTDGKTLRVAIGSLRYVAEKEVRLDFRFEGIGYAQHAQMQTAPSNTMAYLDGSTAREFAQSISLTTKLYARYTPYRAPRETLTFSWVGAKPVERALEACRQKPTPAKPPAAP